MNLDHFTAFVSPLAQSLPCGDWSVKAVLMVNAVRGTWKNKRIIDA